MFIDLSQIRDFQVYLMQHNPNPILFSEVFNFDFKILIFNSFTITFYQSINRLNCQFDILFKIKY